MEEGAVDEVAGEYSYTLEYNGEENGYSIHKLTITSPEGETKEIADDFTYFDVEGDELQAELESWFHKGMGVADASVGESFDPQAEQSREEEAYDKLITAYENSEEDLAEVLGMSMEQLDQEMTEYAMDHNLHMDDDRDSIVQGYIEQLVDDADWKDQGEPDQELTDDLNRLRKLSGLEEQSTKTVNGMTVMSDGSPLSFSDWRSETERETGHPMKRPPEEQKRDYQMYLNRCGDK